MMAKRSTRKGHETFNLQELRPSLKFPRFKMLLNNLTQMHVGTIRASIQWPCISKMHTNKQQHDRTQTSWNDHAFANVVIPMIVEVAVIVVVVVVVVIAVVVVMVVVMVVVVVVVVVVVAAVVVVCMVLVVIAVVAMVLIVEGW